MLMKYEDKPIYLASIPVDFRLSIDGLAMLVEEQIGCMPHDGSIYVFYNNNMDKIKCLFWDRNGFVLYYKKLESTRFILNKAKTGMITHDDLTKLLSGSRLQN